jgi:hypothetical protein
MKNDMLADTKDTEMQSQKSDSPVKNRSYSFSFVALVFLGLDWTLADICGWASCWVWAGLQGRGRLLEWGRLLKWGRLPKWGRLLKWGCLAKPGHSLDCSPLERQPALVKAEVSLLSHLIPVLGTNRC